jgi:amidase
VTVLKQRVMRVDGSSAAMRSYAIGAGTGPVGRVALGELFTMITLDASGGQITATAREADLDLAQLFPVTGPVYIDGVEAGNGVGIEIRKVSLLGSLGHLWTRSGLGAPPGHVGFAVMPVELASLELTIGSLAGLRVPARPHVGALGVSPSFLHEARTLGAYGGNIDTPYLAEGATLWVRAQVDGALIFAGDVHAGIGSAELCGTGIEVAAEVELVVQRSTTWSPSLPTVITAEGRVWVIGVGPTVEAALLAAAADVLCRIENASKASRDQTYLAVSALLQTEICQVVNPLVSVAVSLSGGLDSVLIPEDLRSKASSGGAPSGTVRRTDEC